LFITVIAYSLISGALRPAAYAGEAQAVGAATRASDGAALQKELNAFSAAFERWRGQSANPATPDDFKILSAFGDVFERVRRDYVKEVDDHILVTSAISAMEKLPIGSSAEDLIGAALNGMVTSLDDRSKYYDLAAFRALQLSSRGGDIGAIGVEGVMDGSEFRILHVFDNSPATKAGLRIGDHIASIDGKTLESLQAGEAMTMLRGPIGSKVNVAFRRPGQQPFAIDFTREVVRNDEVKAKLDRGIAYIRVSQLVATSASRLRNAIDRLKSEAGGRPLSYILDLRNDPGGLLDQAVAVAKFFLDKGDVLTTQTRHPENVQSYTAIGKDMTEGAPIVVLINEQTASGAEIIAAALRDNHRAILMGSRSYGQGSIQTIMPIPGHGALRLTTAYIQTPSGRLLQGVGLEPDIAVAWVDPPEPATPSSLFKDAPADGQVESATPEHLFGDTATDVQYARAIEYLRHATQRNGTER